MDQIVFVQLVFSALIVLLVPLQDNGLMQNVIVQFHLFGIMLVVYVQLEHLVQNVKLVHFQKYGIIILTLAVAQLEHLVTIVCFAQPQDHG